MSSAPGHFPLWNSHRGSSFVCMYNDYRVDDGSLWISVPKPARSDLVPKFSKLRYCRYWYTTLHNIISLYLYIILTPSRPHSGKTMFYHRCRKIVLKICKLIFLVCNVVIVVTAHTTPNSPPHASTRYVVGTTSLLLPTRRKRKRKANKKHSNKNNIITMYTCRAVYIITVSTESIYAEDLGLSSRGPYAHNNIIIIIYRL